MSKNKYVSREFDILELCCTDFGGAGMGKTATSACAR